MSKKKEGKNKIRVQFRKNRSEKARVTDWTRKFDQHGFEEVSPEQAERISGKGELAKKRTVIGEIQKNENVDGQGFEVTPDIDLEKCRSGRVLRVFGLSCDVEAENDEICTEAGMGDMLRLNKTPCVARLDTPSSENLKAISIYHCVTRRVLKTLATDQRHVVVAGDRVYFREPERNESRRLEGIIERVEPRHGTIARESRNRKHIIVTNVDQVIIVTSAAEPTLKPNLIDRILVTSERASIRPVICINKIDLVDVAGLQPLIGVYSQMGYKVILTSPVTGFGIERLKKQLTGRESVVTGQSGVGKSSLLNAVAPELELRVSEVSEENQKGKHTTTTAELLRLSFGGYVIDTPGIRQFSLWDIIPEEVTGYFRDLHPFENLCRFPNCTHTHEFDCAVKNGVAEGLIDLRRYDSYLNIRKSHESL